MTDQAFRKRMSELSAFSRAVSDRVQRDVAHCPFQGRVARDAPRWREWLRERLLRFGMTAMAAQTGYANECAVAVAHRLLSDAAAPFPEWAHPAFLTGENELDYWRAVTIAAETVRR